MKKLFVILLGISVGVFCFSCEKIIDKEDANELKGDQSPMGEVGVIVSSGSAEIAGVSDFSAVVTELKEGVSTYTASAKVTNTFIKNMVSGFPGVTINGDDVTITNLKMQQTTEGIKCLTGPGAGVLVKYDSKVGDTYPVGNTGKERKVVSKSGEDDYPYGFFLIKTIQVETTPIDMKSGGIQKITYIANHKFGMVGVRVDFDDETSVTFPVYSSAEN
ncbi:hypothetical protein [Lentimicrobium sp.]|uniref:hypothetical protein n=1 Tax=Lentimicrobium sp. TaxID=2034841 RepID=UPI002C618BAA|nr:hypothetical protein [Lentimicrobium sp.]HOP14395.1 hypothetical protein [Lentimicrobium sp.]HPJ63174.1 hypothetical protein [Lentimicrobium sp.]